AEELVIASQIDRERETVAHGGEVGGEQRPPAQIGGSFQSVVQPRMSRPVQNDLFVNQRVLKGWRSHDLLQFSFLEQKFARRLRRVRPLQLDLVQRLFKASERLVEVSCGLFQVNVIRQTADVGRISCEQRVDLPLCLSSVALQQRVVVE